MSECRSRVSAYQYTGYVQIECEKHSDFNVVFDGDDFATLELMLEAWGKHMIAQPHIEALAGIAAQMGLDAMMTQSPDTVTHVDMSNFGEGVTFETFDKEEKDG